ncbi:MAG: ABA4-like family protein [Bacteroidota bacterium]
MEVNYAKVFEYINTLAFFAWLLLLIAPYWKWTPRLLIGGVVTLFAALYVYGLSQSLSFEDLENFTNLEGLMGLFTSPQAVVVGWLHYLAFDLMVGCFIVANAARHQINRYLLIPCLLFTFMMGPTGLLLYLLLRWAITKEYFAAYH